MKQKIIRQDGIEYERKIKNKKYDTNLCLRLSQKNCDILQELANKKGIKRNTLCREVLEKYIKMEKRKNNEL
jgi:predicted DNA binding CopG/RHH family protein